MPVAWAAMDDGIVHTQAFEAKVFGSARSIIEFDEYLMDRIPNRYDLVDFLASHCLSKNREPPKVIAHCLLQDVQLRGRLPASVMFA